MGFHAAAQLQRSAVRPRRLFCSAMSWRCPVLVCAILGAAFAVTAAGDSAEPVPACPAPRRGDDGVLLEPAADVFLGAFVQAHEPATDALLGCGPSLAQGVESLELFKWAVALLNRDQGFVPGVKIGMRVFDSCGHKARAYLQLDALLPVLRGSSETCVGTANSSRVIGTLMTSTLRDEELIGSLLREHDVPTIPMESSAIATPEYLAKLLLESAFDMKWEHFAVLHSHDEPSLAVVKALSQRAVSAASPCVTLVESLPLEGGDRARLRLRTLLAQLEDTTPVFVVAAPDSADSLAELIASDPDSFLRHRQWFFSWVPGEEALRRLGPLLNRGGFYALAPYPPTVGSFEDHWANLSLVADARKPQDHWYLELVASQKRCRIQGVRVPGLENAAPCPDLSVSREPALALVRTSRALPAARGVFTLAQALRSAWKALCRGQAGLCPELRRLTRRQFAGSFLEPGAAASKAGGDNPVPGAGAVSGRGARAASDVLGELGGSHLALTRFLYDAVKGIDFKQLILYDSEEAKLLQKDTRFMPALCSADTCRNCIRFRTTRLEEAEAAVPSASSLPASDAGIAAADIVVPVLLPLHDSGHAAFECGDSVNRLAVQDLEAASWMVRKINSNGQLLPGLKLELRMIDTCSSASILTRDVSAVLEHFSELGVPTVFVASSLSPENTRVAASLLSRLNVTLVSTTDLAASHDPHKGYLYQIPLPVEKIAEAAVAYLQSLDWGYVSVVSSESESRAAGAFKERAETARICLAVQATLAEGRDLDPNLVTRLATAAASGARAVVLWTNAEDTLRFLAELRRARSEGLLDHADLVLMHGGGQPVSFDGHEEEALGAVLLRPQYGQVLDFESYYERLRPDQDRFFGKLWSQARSCHHGQQGQECSVPLLPSRSVVDVMQAVLVAATALRDLREQVCGGSQEAADASYCARLLSTAVGVGEALDEHVRRATTMRVGDKAQVFAFTDHGHGDIAVDLWNVRKSSAGIAPQRAGHLVDNRFTELVPVVTYGGGEGKEVALSELRSACVAATCQQQCARKAVDFLVVPSPEHVYLAASFSVHERGDAPFRCSPRVSESGVRRVEAFLWALDQINASPSVLPGVRLGAVVFDVCGSREKTYRDLANFASGSLASLATGVRLPNLERVFGFVASGRNSGGQCTVKPAADVLATAAGVPTVASDSSLSHLGGRRYPSLLRVLPSNAEVAQAFLRVLRHFKWTYVSAVFDDQDDELQDVWEQFERAVEGGPLRLATSLRLRDDASNETLRGAAMQLLRRRREGARVVVLFLKDKTADALLTHLHEVASSASSQSSDLTFVALNLRHVLSRHADLALGSLSLRLAPADVPGFRDHLQRLSYSGNVRDPWYRAYVEQKTGCRGPAACANALPPSMAVSGSGAPSLDEEDAGAAASTVTAVFALASGLDQARKTRCPVEDKPCELLMDDAYRSMVMNFTRNVRITRHDGSIFKFADGNSGNGRVQVTYYRSPGAAGLPGEFSQIGTYNRDEGLQMNASLPEVAPGRSPYTVNSSCDADADCNRSPRAKDTSQDPAVQAMLSADEGPSLTIGAVLPVHRKGSDMFSCGDLHNDGMFQSMLAIAYALDRVNRNHTDDLRMDAVVFDSCGTPQRAESLVYNHMVSSLRDAKAKPLVSMITFETKVAEEVEPVLNNAGVPLVLTSRTPKFSQESQAVGIQTLPPVGWQVEATLGVLRHYDWSYAYFIYAGDEFGQDAYYHVTKSLARFRLCVADSQRVDPDATEEDVLATVMKLTDPDVRVVVVLSQDKQVSARIVAAARRASLLERFVWVGTEGFSDSPMLLEVLHGADVDVFSLQLDNEPLPDYARFVSSLTLGRHEPVPDAWFEEFWQLEFGCRLPNARRVHEQFGRICTGRETWRPELRQDRYVYHTVDTVTRIAKAVRAHVAKNCPSALMGGLESLEACKKSALRSGVSVELLGTDPESCSECQPSTIATFGYRLLKLNGSSARNYTYQNVGSFRNKVLRVSDDQVDFFSGVAPMSTCVRDCDERCPASSAAGSAAATDNEYLRQHRESLTANFRTVWGIVVTALSLLGMVLVIICALYFLMAFPVTVGTTVLGYMILVGLLALYAVNFAFVVGATEGSCGVRRFLMGLAYSIIFSGMLVKVLNTWRLMGYHQRMHHDTTQLSSPAGLLLVACGLVVIQVVLTAAWLVLMPPRIGLYERVWRCAPPASFEDELVVSMVYVMLLLAVTILFSVLTWPCRENNGESRWILACCVSVALAWFAWTVLGTQLPTRFRDATIAVANLVCATLVMLCLYLRKVYLYNKLARQARDQEIKARLQPRGPPYTPSVYGTLHKSAPTVAPVFYGSQGTLTTSKKLNGQFSRLSTDDLASDGSGSVQVQGADLYPLEMYDGGSQFQPPSSLYGSMMMLDDNVAYAR